MLLGCCSCAFFSSSIYHSVITYPATLFSEYYYCYSYRVLLPFAANHLLSLADAHLYQTSPISSHSHHNHPIVDILYMFMRFIPITEILNINCQRYCSYYMVSVNVVILMKRLCSWPVMIGQWQLRLCAE